MTLLNYRHNFEEANSYLRLSLSMLGKYNLPPNLINFTLCYEYVMKSNKVLMAELDKCFNNGGLTDDKSEELFKKYIWDKDKRFLEQLNNVLSEQLKTMLGDVQTVHEQTSSSTSQLDHHAKRLQSTESPESIKEISNEILIEANNILNTNQSFEEKLNKTQSELEGLKKELKQTKEQSETDPLTNLKNRRAFDTRLDEEIERAKANSSPVTLIIFDIDHFKNINDQYGHIVGDKVIRYVANILLKRVRKHEMACRFGGEEFTVLLPGSNGNNALAFAEGIRKQVETSTLSIHSTNEKIENLTISAGISIYSNHEDSESFINRADKALYLSKSNGRNKSTSL
ncbi:MAG: diguanylate cyclase [Gammaproteobacteria bacterium]|nr:diguanylate cyclase [Gammaproteobacteria bacterium]